MFFSESTCAPADEDAATSAAKPVTRPNRIHIESSLVITRAIHGQSRPPPMTDYVTREGIFSVVVIDVKGRKGGGCLRRRWSCRNNKCFCYFKTCAGTSKC